MLKALIKKDLSDVFSRYFRGNRRARKKGGARKLSGAGMAILLVILTLYIVGIFVILSLSLCKTIAGAGMSWLYFLLLTGMAILFGTLGSVFSTYSTLYLAKDNDLLLSMPIPLKDIILSRLLSVYLMGLLYSATVSVPAVAVYLVVIGLSVPALIGGLVLILLISLVVLGLSCLLGWVVAKLSLRLKNRSFLTVLIALVFVVLYYVVYFRFMNNAQSLLESMMQFGVVMKDRAPLVYLLGSIGTGDWEGMLVWIGVVGVALFLLWLLLKRTFLTIAIASPTPKHTVYREKTARMSSVNAALLRRERLRFTSSANYMLNCGLGLLALPAAGIFLLVKGVDLLQSLSQSLPGFSGMATVGFGAACCIMGSLIDVTAPSVSLEGRSIWQIQSLPVTPWQVLRAKLCLHLCLAALPVAVWLVCVLAAVPESIGIKLLLLALSLLSVLWIALLGLTLGVKRPNLTWTNEIVPIKQSAPVVITVFAGLGLGTAMIGLYLLFGWTLGPAVWLGAFTAFLLAFDVLLWLWLRSRGAKRFSTL